MSLLMLIGVAIVWNQYQHSHQQTNRIAEDRLSMLAQSLQPLLDAGEYDRIQPVLDDWGRYHESTLLARITARNGFEHGVFERPVQSSHRINLSKTLRYGYRGEATLIFTYDASESLHKTITSAIAVGLALFIVYLFSFLLMNRNRKLASLGKQVR